jgi:hypothetical protein
MHFYFRSAGAELLRKHRAEQPCRAMQASSVCSMHLMRAMSVYIYSENLSSSSLKRRVFFVRFFFVEIFFATQEFYSPTIYRIFTLLSHRFGDA